MAFWSYLPDKLCWPQAFAPGPLQALVRGLAGHLDIAREDMPYLRINFSRAAELVPDAARRAAWCATRARHRSSSAPAWRAGWHMLGGKTLGLPRFCASTVLRP